MMKKIIWIIAIIVLVVVAVTVFFYMKQYRSSIQSEEQNLRDLESALEESNKAPKFPSANPINSIAPNVNPVSATNPFKDVYENPFE